MGMLIHMFPQNYSLVSQMNEFRIAIKCAHLMTATPTHAFTGSLEDA